eukprot:PhF_6_TR19575/c0_g1_i1/m.28537/K03743/pncC; nicotinamide-nucleotide amidase
MFVWILLLIHIVSSTVFPTAVIDHPCPRTPTAYNAYCLDVVAHDVIRILRTTQHQIITAESLTSGMIASTLVSVVGGGSVVIGGAAVYATSYKRTVLGVEVVDVYTKECALEMARGALETSGGAASIGVAVTGHAGPVSNVSSDVLGRVHIGVVWKGRGGVDYEVVYEVDLCGRQGSEFSQRMCRKTDTREVVRYLPVSSYALTVAHVTRESLRLDTTLLALNAVRQILTQ